ncbi:MAG TPA: hypothetical protein VFP49_05300, partial [Nitrososphaeraceae archaeon]|nr:hypothetical protein [Nitrososphaeraceae archaeon]
FENKDGQIDSKTNSKGEELTEDRCALTSQDLIKIHKEIHNETLTGKKLLQSYIYPLLNQGYIDYIDSIIDKRAKIYYPIITTKKYRNLFQKDERNNLLQQTEKIVVNSTTFPSKVYILSRIEPILKYSSEIGYITKIKNHLGEDISLEELLDQYFDNSDDYFIIENLKQRAAEVKGWNSVPNPTDINDTTIDEDNNNPTNPAGPNNIH